MIRLVPNHADQIQRAAKVRFTFDGVPVTAHAGETVAVALLRAGQVHLRDAPEDGAARGAFCLMGLCQECAVRVDGKIVESCRQPVTEGLAVQSLRRAAE
jgi:predicted molibdopterin-dependent oxidoreductase YjgC